MLTLNQSPPLPLSISPDSLYLYLLRYSDWTSIVVSQFFCCAPFCSRFFTTFFPPVFASQFHQGNYLKHSRLLAFQVGLNGIFWNFLFVGVWMEDTRRGEGEVTGRGDLEWLKISRGAVENRFKRKFSRSTKEGIFYFNSKASESYTH